MTGAVFEGDGKLVLKQRPVPKVEKPNEVLIQVEATGICGTDIHILEVPPRHAATAGVILGHEFAGRIADIGSEVRNVNVGDPVAVDPNAPCGHCETCRNGYPNACLTAKAAPVPGYFNTRGIFRDGAMARYIVYPATDVYRVSPDVPMAHAAVAEPLGVALNGMNKVGIRPGETVAVLGGGPIGLMFMGLAKAAGARVIASEPIALRREVAKACGADLVVDPTRDDIVKVVKEETGGAGADVVGEFVGHVLDVCVEIAKFAGRILVVGCDALARPEINQVRIMFEELQIIGAVLPRFTFSRALKTLEEGLLPMDKIVSHRLPLNQVHEGMQLIRDGKAVKVVLCPTDDDVQG